MQFEDDNASEIRRSGTDPTGPCGRQRDSTAQGSRGGSPFNAWKGALSWPQAGFDLQFVSKETTKDMPTDGVAITTDTGFRTLSMRIGFYPWYCHAIRGHNSYFWVAPMIWLRAKPGLGNPWSFEIWFRPLTGLGFIRGESPLVDRFVFLRIRGFALRYTI